MAIKKSDAVKFVYVNGNSLPSKVDDATIYIIGGTQELYVGNLKIAASIDVDSALSATSTNPVENQAITKELNKKATIESPTFTGIPNASTAAAGTSTTQIATTAFVQNAVTAATIIVDDALNASSTNPVQNKVIKAALDAKAALASPTFTGTPKAPTAAAGTNTTQIATTAFVKTAVDNAAITIDSSLSDSSTNPVQNKIIKSALDGKANTGDMPTATSTTPKMDGTASVGTETQFAKGDHVHPSDTTKANLASPTFTGAPKAPTASAGTSTTQIATTEFVQNAVDAATPTYTAVTGKPTGNQTPAFGGTATISQVSQSTTGQVSVTDRTIKIPNTEASTSAAGLMSKDDKSKLDGIESGANKIIVDNAMSTTSTNPVQNKVVKQAINDAIAASDAMIFKGTLGTGGTITALPTTYKTGWTYRVITAGTYAGNVCEIGDLIIALTDRSGSGNVDSDWTVAQTNINGAITSISGTSPIEVSGSGSSRTIAHKAYTARTGKPTANQTPAFGGTATVSQITSDATGHVTGATDRTIKIPDTVATTSASGLMSSDDKTKLDGIENGAQANAITGVKGNAESSYRTGDVNITPANIGALPLTGGNISKESGIAYINNVHLDVKLEESDNGVTATQRPSHSRSYVTLDGANTLSGAFEHVYSTTGETGLDLSIRNYNIETSKLTGYTHFGVYIDKTGKVRYGVSNPPALKKALGIFYGTCETAAGTAAKVITLDAFNSYGFMLSVGAIIGVKFLATNTADNPTLNVDGTGAKKIWYGDALITTENNQFAGQKDIITFFFYDGTQWVWMGHSLNNADGYLPLTGGTISGATTIQDIFTVYRSGTTAQDLPAGINFSINDTTTGKTYSSAYIYAYQNHGANTYGANVVFNPGGNMIIGSGESAANHYAALKDVETGIVPNTEIIYLTSDTAIHIQAGGNNIANRKGVQITTAGALVPDVKDVATDNVQSIGTADYKWKDVYATTIHGNLDGNATTATSATKLVTARTIDGVDFDGSAAIIHYGTCATAAGTAAKVVACTSFKLVTGSTIRVKFTVTNTANNPTLNVNSTGAKNIFYKGAAITAGYLIKDHVYEFVYDGTQYCLVGEIYSATTTSIGSASAGTAIAADDITAWSAGTAASASVSGGVLTITNGTAPSLSYTARSIPNISVTNKTVVTGI